MRCVRFRWGGLSYLRRSAADVVGLQETRVINLDRCNAGMQAAKAAKWKVKLTPAQVTEKGYASAGVAVACRAPYGMTHPQVQGWGFDGTRIHHAHLRVACRGGIHCLSVYLYTCEGLSERNCRLLRELARLVKGVHGPWIILGDWNMPPDVLQASV